MAASVDGAFGAALGAIALVPVGRYLWVALHRLGYPYELEWMEGGAVGVTRRVAHGLSLYGPPSLHFTPWPYPPLYFWITGGLSEITRVGFLPLRLVSLAASLAVLGLLYILVASETGDRPAGVLAAGLYAATYQLGGAWADIGRVDSLFIALALAGILMARRSHGPGQGAVAGILLFLSFLTKQDGLIVAVPVVGWLLLTRRRVGLGALGGLVGLLAVSTVALDAVSHGWYRYYVFSELLGQGIVHHEIRDFWTLDLNRSLPYVVLAALLSLPVMAMTGRARRSRRALRGRRALRSRDEPALQPWWDRVGFFTAAAGGLLAASWAGRLHNGGWWDVLMPGFAALALLAGLGVGEARGQSGLSWRLFLTLAFGTGLVAQLERSWYPLRQQVPTAADRRTGDAFIREVAHLPPGQVIVLDHPYYATLAGRGTNADEEAVDDILRSGPSRARRVLRADLHSALVRPGIVALIIDDPGDRRELGGELAADYHLLPAPAVSGTSFYPVTDLRLRPMYIYLRNAPRAR